MWCIFTKSFDSLFYSGTIHIGHIVTICSLFFSWNIHEAICPWKQELVAAVERYGFKLSWNHILGQSIRAKNWTLMKNIRLKIKCLLIYVWKDFRTSCWSHVCIERKFSPTQHLNLLFCYSLKRLMLSHVKTKDYAKILNYSAAGRMGKNTCKIEN